MSSIKLSVVIPAYNEAKNLDKGALKEVDDYLKKQDYLYEVLIIDDGSTDETVKLVEEQIKNKKNFRLIKNPHGGKALTVISGMLKASGEIALFTDMDQATPIDQIEKFFPKFEEGFDVVIGSRQGRKGAPLLRKFMGLGFSIIRFIILGLPFADTQCGFKAFNQPSIKAIFPQVQKIWEENKVKGAAVNAGFDVETLFLTRKKEFKIAEVIVDWRHVGTERVQAINDSLEALRDVIRIRLNDLQKKYG
ncbi:MAG: glycosyltransferase [Candidatus Daviesbacteria bacterium]|nr:glycosyltransferase [Candidatus Daviesbacteria bacterium]